MFEAGGKDEGLRAVKSREVILSHFVVNIIVVGLCGCHLFILS